ncbi:MAG TPA: HEAT repeat domain-containing protein [Methanoregulaceae archaeon]|nr:HEAT repeat domain-containing protein [Methanoregulaceae archaeon]
MSLFDTIFGKKMNKNDFKKLHDNRDVQGYIDALPYCKKNAENRMDIAIALGNIGDNKATDTLIELLNDNNEFVRIYAADALGKIQDSKAIEPLTWAIADNEPQVRIVAKQALDQMIGKSNININEYYEVKRKNILQLSSSSKVKNEEIAKNIEKLNSQNWEKRESAAIEGSHSFSRWWDPDYYYYLIATSFDDHPRVREAALKSLGDMLMEDHMSYVKPSISPYQLPSNPNNGQNLWRKSNFYPINRLIVDSAIELLDIETEAGVREEAQDLLKLAQEYL